MLFLFVSFSDYNQSMNSPEACRKRVAKYVVPVFAAALVFNIPKFLEAYVHWEPIQEETLAYVNWWNGSRVDLYDVRRRIATLQITLGVCFQYNIRFQELVTARKLERESEQLLLEMAANGTPTLLDFMDTLPDGVNTTVAVTGYKPKVSF